MSFTLQGNPSAAKQHTQSIHSKMHPLISKPDARKHTIHLSTSEGHQSLKEEVRHSYTVYKIKQQNSKKTLRKYCLTNK